MVVGDPGYLSCSDNGALMGGSISCTIVGFLCQCEAIVGGAENLVEVS